MRGAQNNRRWRCISVKSTVTPEGRTAWRWINSSNQLNQPLMLLRVRKPNWQEAHNVRKKARGKISPRAK